MKNGQAKTVLCTTSCAENNERWENVGRRDSRTAIPPGIDGGHRKATENLSGKKKKTLVTV